MSRSTSPFRQGLLKSFDSYWKTSGTTLRWAVPVILLLILAIVLVMMFLLAQATGNSALYERNFERLLVVNLVLAVILFAIIVWMGWRVWSRYRRGRFGSKLLLKLAAAFVLVASVPGALIYLVSYQFVSSSIESWFDVKVETALGAGLNLGRNVLDTMTRDTGIKTQIAGEQLVNTPTFSLNMELERLRQQQNAEHMLLWSQSGERIASAGGALFAASAGAPTPELIAELHSKPVVASIEGLEASTDVDIADAQAEQKMQQQLSRHARIVAYTLVRTSEFGLLEQAWILQVVQPLPQELLQNALMVQDANRDYQERALARSGMTRMFIGTLTLTLILAVFGAVLLAAVLATQLARPLLLLAEGVKQVARGDLSPKQVYEADDELAGLTRSFSMMTQQLADAQQALTSSMAELDASRAELQTILDNLSSGVMVLDADDHVLSVNPAAERILQITESDLLGHELAGFAGLEQLAQAVASQFEMMQEGEEPAPLLQDSALEQEDELLEERFRSKSTSEYWQQTVELNPGSHAGLQQDNTTLMLRGVKLPVPDLQGARLLVFEDISAIISAQRAQAWGEVARRLAHEIKNPLTPIQLSAERMEIKLMDNLPQPQQAILSKSVRTIVEQVDAMKRLVNEFRDYARLPAAELSRIDLNALVTDVVQMYEAGASGQPVPVVLELDPECRPVMADAQQLRQVIHNLVQNAQDAHEHAGLVDRPVLLQTQWRPMTRRVRLSIKDEGGGFPEHILVRAFEPYVTTKSKGTGLGLAVVKKIADEHGARLKVGNREPAGEVAGAQVSLLFPPLPEGDEESTGTTG